LKICFVTAFGKFDLGEHLPAGHTNSKLAMGIFLPGLLTQQYNWLIKSRGRHQEKTFEKFEGFFIENPPQKRA